MAERIRIEGLGAVTRKLERMARAAGDEAASGTRILAENILTDVKANRSGKGVPEDEGILKNSGRADGPDASGAVEITFGDTAAPYALYQHERMDLHHDLGEARYLVRGLERATAARQPERALDEVMDELIRIGKVTT